ncbi:MAG TPA: NAD-dependent deacylase [Xanthomonadaceae bacterium]|nr:NAD-dependent deacylase [Xanthomonadaceae bacterium]
MLHDPDIASVVTRLRSARHVLILTGAGVSAESGVPTFREAQTGLWAQFDPHQLATPDAFARDPARIWAWYRWRKELLRRAQPNDAHRVIAAWQTRWPQMTVVTQNVDGLHQAAGLREPLELHGSLARARCSGCDMRIDWDDVPDDALPRHACGALLRPDVVWFGEMLPHDTLERAMAAAEDCDLCLAIGTSGVVYPAAALPQVARQSGAFVVELNPESTPLSDVAALCLRMPAGAGMRALQETLARRGDRDRDALH